VGRWLVVTTPGVYALAALAAVLLVLAGWRALDRLADRRAWRALVDAADGAVPRFDEALITDLPAPAQRYFRYTIAPGTPLHSAVELRMTGELGLGTRAAPGYRPMRAHQLLAPPHGLVWRLDYGAVGGSDAALPDRAWTRFWLWHVVPVVRVCSDDHRRSAFGRVVAEAAFWSPASLLPGPFVRWEAQGDDTARAVVHYGGFTQAVEITVAADGAPRRVVIRRWSNANPARVYREQPFGGELSEFRDFGGYRLPTRVEGGNHFGTPDYFAFFKARVTAARIPASGRPDRSALR
jgi:hypothetical protein